VSAALGIWVTPKVSILTVVVGGFFIFPLVQMLLRLSCRRASPSALTVIKENSFHNLGMQVAFVLPFSMLLLVPVGLYDLNLFFPALMVLLGPHYLPFATLYGMRMFLIPRGNPDRPLFLGNVQPGRMGRRPRPICLRLDWPFHRKRRIFAASTH